MKLTHLLLAIALVGPFMGCDFLTLEDSKLTKLGDRIAELEIVVSTFEASLRLLQAENENLAAEVTVANTTIEKQDQLMEKLLIENSQLNGMIDSYVGIIDGLRDQIDIIPAPKTSSWPPMKGDNISFKINFDHNKLYNKEESIAVADMVLAYAKAVDGNVKITVEGYSSKSGSAKLNRWFSKERAEGVMHKIQEAHNDGPLNIEIIAHGETDDDERKVIVTVGVL